MIANRHATNAQVRGAECSVFANSGAFPGGYIGESTRREIAYARRLGKPIRYTHSSEGGGSGFPSKPEA
ncbi:MULTISPECIES: hypothetical protein [unclassified Streptomyces]|uniref:hypothetical protein n=1 Tax=unclassified Streptomyces TaxID=2593676 RepID=UPI0033B3AE35